eukprot:7806535-Lingulodinium_polyedra.AAC.1
MLRDCGRPAPGPRPIAGGVAVQEARETRPRSSLGAPPEAQVPRESPLLQSELRRLGRRHVDEAPGHWRHRAPARLARQGGVQHVAEAEAPLRAEVLRECEGVDAPRGVPPDARDPKLGPVLRDAVVPL